MGAPGGRARGFLAMLCGEGVLRASLSRLCGQTAHLWDLSLRQFQSMDVGKPPLCPALHSGALETLEKGVIQSHTVKPTRKLEKVKF